MKKGVNNGKQGQGDSGERPKQKERHIVSWTQEEDDILRDQIRVHGTENWGAIASKFKDKTTRQCRRRWFTYLNSDFKKGGWSREEDMLLCEAQKVFGNRRTEIAKVVSGRTDNAVKNRFNTLCKKRAKHETLAKENSSTSYITLNNKRVILPHGLNTEAGSENAVPLKKKRKYISDTPENCCLDKQFSGECGISSQLLRLQFAVIDQNFCSCMSNFSTQPHDSHMKEKSTGGTGNNKTRGTYLQKDDQKVLALMQQAELLSSLAVKINSEKMGQSLENACMVLQDFLKQKKENDLFTFENSDADFQFKTFEELVDALTCSNECSAPLWRPPDLYVSSPTSSEYSTRSTLCNKIEELHAEISMLHQKAGQELQSNKLSYQNCKNKEIGMCCVESTDKANAMLTCHEINANDGAACEFSNAKFSSPVQVTPMFREWAATIPSPKFSESEKHFLMKALGMKSASVSPISNPSQPPLCKRSLLHCL